jgi:hypothetical protein
MDLQAAARGAITSHRMRERIRREGQNCKGHWLWTRKEDELVKTLYPNYLNLRKALPRRSFEAIKARACGLGVTKKLIPWTTTDISRLRKLSSRETTFRELEAEFPGRNKDAIRAAAQYHKIKKKRRSLKSTGFGSYDQIRRRATELNISMSDLDYLAGTRRFFQTSAWRCVAHPNGKIVFKAVAALGGRLVIEWD